jgi:hypothetical protein
MNTVVMLTRDLKAKAGQFLVVRADNSVFAVDADMLPLVLQGGVATQKPTPIVKTLNRREAVVVAKEMIIAGEKTKEIIRVTGLARVTIYRHRNAMVDKGLVVRKRGRNPSGHRFYKTPEALEKARQRGEFLKNIRTGKDHANG